MEPNSNYNKINRTMLNDNPETIFRIGGEGGSISICRVKDKSGFSFVSELNEADLTEESEGVHRVEKFNDFNEAFKQLDSKYAWHRLYILSVHMDYTQQVAGKLIERLNDEELSPYKYSFRYEFEEMLGIKIDYSNGKWSII